MTTAPVSPAPRRRLRSFGAALAGIATVVALSTITDQVLHASGIFPPPGQPMATGLWVLAAAYRCVYGVLGSWIAARLAPDRPMAHAMLLGWVGLALSALGVVVTWNLGPGYGPRWYPISLVVTALPCAWLGGKLAMRSAERRAG